MLGTYFFYRDGDVRTRQSQGVYFVRDSKTGLVFLFCGEQEIYWRYISSNGDLLDVVQMKKPALTPLNLLEIQELGYLQYVSGVTKITASGRDSMVF